MNITTAFDLGQRVTINEIGLAGRVTEISVGYGGNLYKIYYWRENEPKDVWCREDELVAAAVPAKIGMGGQ